MDRAVSVMVSRNLAVFAGLQMKQGPEGYKEWSRQDTRREQAAPVPAREKSAIKIYGRSTIVVRLVKGRAQSSVLRAKISRIYKKSLMEKSEPGQDVQDSYGGER